MEEFLSNLTLQVLTNESDKVVIAFDKIGFLVIDLLEQFVKIEQELYKDSEILGENLDKTIKENIEKFQSGEKKLLPEPKIKTAPSANKQKQYFETAITLN